MHSAGCIDMIDHDEENEFRPPAQITEFAMDPIYLDHNATTGVWPQVREAMGPYLAEHFGNPSSAHAFGAAAREAVDEARRRLAQALLCDAEQVVFTSGGSESNNLALKGVFDYGRRGGHLVISAIEHPAIEQVARFLEDRGVEVTRVPVSSQGVVDPSEVAAAITEQTRLVSIMLANNEIGTIQPIAQLGRLCQARNVLLHTDAAQAIGKIPVRFQELGVDLLSVAGHKMYAPKGVGALLVKQEVDLVPLIHGADHEAGLRAGTENVASIVGLGVAAIEIARGLDEAAERMTELRDRFAQALRAAIGEELVVHGEHARRLPNTLSVAFPGVVGHELLERAGRVAASTGAACHSGDEVHSATLAAMELPPAVAAGTVRLSLGWSTTAEQTDQAASLLIDAWEGLRSS